MGVVRKITALQKAGKYRVTVREDDDKESEFIISKEVLIRFRLQRGQSFSPEDLRGLQREEKIQEAYDRAVRFLSFRMRTRKEVVRHLQKNQVAEDIAELVIQRLEKNGYLNDEKFAKAFMATKIKLNHSGPKMLERGLIAAGVDEETAARALEEYSFSEQVETALALANKYFSRQKGKSNAARKLAVIQHLRGKGFPSEVIDVVLQEGQFEQPEDEEWQALIKQAKKAEKKYCRDGEAASYKMRQFLYRKGFTPTLIEKYFSEKWKNG